MGTNTLALQASLDVQNERFFADIEKFAFETGRGITDVLQQRSKLLTRTLVKITPPFRSLNDTAESFGEQRRIGELAVSGGVNRVYGSIEDLGVFKAPRNQLLFKNIKQAVETDDTQALDAFLGLMHITSVPVSDIILEADSSAYDQQRDNRGRVPKNTKQKWWIVRAARRKAFLRKKTALVGRLKGGWCAAASHFGVSLPGWITRHATGNVIDKSGDWRNTAYVRIQNTVSYANKQDADLRIILIATRNEAGKMERALEAKTNGAWEKSGAGK